MGMELVRPQTKVAGCELSRTGFLVRTLKGV